MRAFRYLKYAVAAPAIGFLIRNTKILDGDGAPPPFINFAGGGDFRALGQDLVQSLKARAELSAQDRVLDIGSGIGRVAVALAKDYPKLDYLGFEIVRYGIDWSRKRLTHSSSFRFEHADIHNSFYNPRGAARAENFRFPADDHSRDLILATSVFTHLPQGAVETYMAEMARVLSKTGRIYLTTFLADRRASGAAFSFGHRTGAAFLESVQEPDLAVAYESEFWSTLAQSCGLQMAKVFQGTWSSADAGFGPIGPEFQDTIIFQRKGQEIDD